MVVPPVHDMAPEHHEHTLQEEDERRKLWVESIVGANIRDPANYDMVISTGHVTPEQAADAVVAAFGGQR